MELNLEEFQDIKTNDRYMINKCGDIYSKRKKAIMKQHISNKGYATIKLYKNNKVNNFLVHRLVAFTFLDNPDNKPIIDHKNRIKLDNNCDNLRWVTHSENLKNKTVNPNATSKYPGVYFVKGKKTKPWRAQSSNGKKKYSIGYYNTPEEAYDAYKKYNLEMFNVEILDQDS